MENIMPKDMPKLESPFIRKEINGNYVVTPIIPENMKWVFEDPTVLAVEKLNGTNVSIIIEDGNIKSIWNRLERLHFFNKGKQHIIMGVMNAYERGYCDLPDGQWFGECIGTKINGNPYNIEGHLWIPFKTYAWGHLHYTSWGKYPKTYETISEWFKDLMPLYSLRTHGKDYGKHYVEGIVFTHPDGRMAKLRKDMFPWASEQGIHPHKHVEQDK